MIPVHEKCAKRKFNWLVLLTKNCNLFFSRTPLSEILPYFIRTFYEKNFLTNNLCC